MQLLQVTIPRQMKVCCKEAEEASALYASTLQAGRKVLKKLSLFL